jgi:uroporphyrinogen decarboxylase
MIRYLRDPWPARPAVPAGPPPLRRLVDFIHRNSDWSVLMHSCGAIRPLLPHLVSSGIDALNPVQISAAGMDPVELKRSFGADLVFWGGGCDTQGVMARGDAAAVAANVAYLTGILGSGGGFVFTAVHNIMGDVEPTSIVALYDAAWAAAQAATP